MQIDTVVVSWCKENVTDSLCSNEVFLFLYKNCFIRILHNQAGVVVQICNPRDRNWKIRFQGQQPSEFKNGLSFVRPCF